MPVMRAGKNHHGTALLVGEIGLLVRGASGSGKSLLARLLLERCRARAQFAALISDDQVLLEARGRRLIARVPDTIEGKMEVRGFGIVQVPHEPSARIHGVIELVTDDDLPRIPNRKLEMIEGVGLPSMQVRGRDLVGALDVADQFIFTLSTGS
ncbi:MAG: HPr kinase/phosphatase C-terminal domain-containing protein [Pseudomonadota bacterium]